MNQKQAERPSVLATDLDGTLIPLAGNSDHRRDLQAIARAIGSNGQQLVFATGRHLASVQQAIEQFDLPMPHWLICDVGTSLYQAVAKQSFRLVNEYHQTLQQILHPEQMLEIRSRLASHQGLELQEDEKQGRFKLSYYTDAAQRSRWEPEIRECLDEEFAIQIIFSVDPFTGRGLVDVLPRDVSKAFALRWWTRHQHVDPEKVVFAGDSGNDYAALVAGYRAIVVGNAPRELAERVVRQATSARAYLARQTASSGVWEGGRHWGLF